MDGYGLADRFKKAAIKAAVGLVLTGALIGGGIAYFSSSHSSNNTTPSAPAATLKAPAPK